MRFPSLFSFCASCVALSVSGSPLAIDYFATRGTLALALGDPAPFIPQQTSPGPDLLFPEGAMLARLEDTAGATVTISFDESQIVTATEEEAYFAFVEDEVARGSPHHAVWRYGNHDWLVQLYTAPGDRILTAQTFVEGHPLAVIFWLPAESHTAFEDPRVHDFFHKFTLYWDPISVASDE